MKNGDDNDYMDYQMAAQNDFQSFIRLPKSGEAMFPSRYVSLGQERICNPHEKILHDDTVVRWLEASVYEGPKQTTPSLRYYIGG